MTARLVSLDGYAEIRLDRPLLLVGRDPRCDARINSPGVSRVHCYLASHKAGFTIRDLGSTNGTRVNDHRAGEYPLLAGDVVSIAGFRYRLETASESGAGRRLFFAGGSDAGARPDPGVGREN